MFTNLVPVCPSPFMSKSQHFRNVVLWLWQICHFRVFSVWVWTLICFDKSNFMSDYFPLCSPWWPSSGPCPTWTSTSATTSGKGTQRWWWTWSAGWRTQSPSPRSCWQGWRGCGLTRGSRSAFPGPTNISWTTLLNSKLLRPHTIRVEIHLL